MRVALVHDWLVRMRGGERVLEQLALMYPGAEIFTLVYDSTAVSPVFRDHRIHTSTLARLPGATRRYAYALPFMPALIEQFDLSRFDLIISSSHCVAKGVRVPAGVPHLCYCHTPMRYLYDQSEAYERRLGLVQRTAFLLVRPRLREWDQGTASRVTHFVANSEHVRARIQACYQRNAVVVHPPVDIDRFTASTNRGDAYVTVTALVPYKRVELMVHAFNTLGRQLVVVGSGPEQSALQRIAGPNIHFTGWISDAEVTLLLSQARGFVYAAVEDFGIALVEAQAAGTPVIAYAAGGALESVIDGETGVLFREQSAAALAAAVLAAEQQIFVPAALRLNAARFRPERFRALMKEQIDQLVAPGAPRPVTV